MPLLDRVTTLIKANLNDLIDKAEDPEKLLKQLLLDMQNQYLQLKTQVAIAIAEQHLLENKERESLEAQEACFRQAELALRKNEEGLARKALELSLAHENAVRGYADQLREQARQVTVLRDALDHLEQKTAETKLRSELLIAQHRRAKLALEAGLTGAKQPGAEETLRRLQAKVSLAEANAFGQQAADDLSAEDRLAALEKADRVERLLHELKTKTLSPGSAGPNLLSPPEAANGRSGSGQ